MASSDLIRDLFGEDSDDEVNTQVNETQNNSSSVPTENNDEEDTSVIEPGTSKANKSSKKIDCKARLNAKKLDDLEANDIAGIRPCKNIRLLEVQSGGPENLGCLPKDCRNFIEERRRLRLGDGDAEAIRKMFATLQMKDRKFFHLMDIDEDGRLRNVLWIHPRSKAAYEDFHDVVSFDTTYLVNRYKMPFASIVGINHHGHSILLGCALVTHENADSFKWLFSNWLEAMGGVYPTAIITDQCESIRKGIEEVMPESRHRFCIWHIFSKVPQKFIGVQDVRNYTVEFKGIVYDSLTIETFETKWAEFLVKYHLENNEWLKGLYNERQKWVPVYLHNTFWAGMISTQRSEGMHAYFDGFVHSRSTLKQFVEQYDIAIGNKIQKEFQADFQSKNKVIKCNTSFAWEKQFQKAYTNSIFNLVQDQIKRMLYCHVVPPTAEEQIADSNDIGIERYTVLERSILNDYFLKEFTYTVEWRPLGAYISCNCRKFEFKDILCCHIMTVLAQNDIQTVNERYLLHRWRKDVYHRHSSIFFAGGYPHMTEEYKKFQEVEKYFQQCADAAMGSTEKMEYIKEMCIDMKNELIDWNSESTTTNADPSVRTSQSLGGTPVLDPNVAVPRGRPRTTHFMPASEAQGGGRGGRRTSDATRISGRGGRGGKRASGATRGTRG
ncbi:hypothetical protein ACS0TY_011360 [Phlomoides rotata]